jgi:hypothetical protein
MKRYFNLKLVATLVVFFTLSFVLSAQGHKLPDLTILKITMDRDCNLAVVVRNNGPGPLPDYVYTKHHPKSAGVFVYINGKSWGGTAIWNFDPSRKLQKPGGIATYISRYKIGAPVDIKAVVDLHNDVKEVNERNNTSYRKQLRCSGQSGQGQGQKVPDLIVRDIRLVNNCKIEVTLKNIGTAGVPASYYNLPDAVGVQMYKDSKPWGGIILSGFDTAGKLKSPGGTATWIWFPNAANLKLTPGIHSIRVVVDNNKKLTELSETNNSLTKRLSCKTIGTIVGTATLGTAVGQSTGSTSATPATSVTPGLMDAVLKPPQRFFIDFTDAYLVFKPATKSIQIVAQTNVLSYGSDWEKCQIKPYLYLIRQKVWKGFHWKVNTAKKEVYKVTGTQFCQLGGNNQKLNITVDVIGGSNTTAPDRFMLHFPKAYLVYVPSTKSLQIATLNTVLSYGGDWQKCNFNGATYHLKENFWKGFYWRVTTGSKPTAVRVRGTFCKAGTFPTEPLSVNVRVVK